MAARFVKLIVMNIVDVDEAKANFSKLVSRASEGEYIVIGKAGKPLAQLEPYSNTKAKHSHFEGGRLQLQIHSKLLLSPENLNRLAGSKYND
jgi:prevent-host-death family protein